MDSLLKYSLMIHMEILWIQAFLNINDIAIVIWIHNQWPIEFLGL
jgi:hypothetical protein